MPYLDEASGAAGADSVDEKLDAVAVSHDVTISIRSNFKLLNS